MGTNLKIFENPVASEFSKSCRKNIRQAINKGISYKITEQPDNLETFEKNFNYSTMDRNHATDYYYFPKEYF